MSGLASKEFRGWFETVLKPCRAMVLQRLADGAQLQPHLLVFDHGDQMAYVPVPMDTIEDKNEVMALQRRIANRPGIIAGVIFVSETWVLSTTDKAEIAERRTMRDGIADHPDRTEGVMWNAVRGDMQLLAFSKIVRAEGKAPQLVDDTLIDPAEAKVEMTGRMVLGGHDKPN